MTEIFLLLALLFVKHFIVDFHLQTETMVKEKGIYGARGGIEHSFQQGVGTFLVMFFFVAWPWAVVFAFIDAVIHYHVDWTKININKKNNYTVMDKQFWFWLGLDQLAHSLTYVWICWMLV